MNTNNIQKVNYQKILDKITDKIETIVEQKRGDIISIIKDEEYERKLKGNKKVLVISSLG